MRTAKPSDSSADGCTLQVAWILGCNQSTGNMAWSVARMLKYCPPAMSPPMLQIACYSMQCCKADEL